VRIDEVTVVVRVSPFVAEAIRIGNVVPVPFVFELVNAPAAWQIPVHAVHCGSARSIPPPCCIHASARSPTAAVYNYFTVRISGDYVGSMEAHSDAVAVVDDISVVGNFFLGATVKRVLKLNVESGRTAALNREWLVRIAHDLLFRVKQLVRVKVED
jgi:hypothetical protein